MGSGGRSPVTGEPSSGRKPAICLPRTLSMAQTRLLNSVLSKSVSRTYSRIESCNRSGLCRSVSMNGSDSRCRNGYKSGYATGCMNGWRCRSAATNHRQPNPIPRLLARLPRQGSAAGRRVHPHSGLLDTQGFSML